MTPLAAVALPATGIAGVFGGPLQLIVVLGGVAAAGPGGGGGGGGWQR